MFRQTANCFVHLALIIIFIKHVKLCSLACYLKMSSNEVLDCESSWSHSFCIFNFCKILWGKIQERSDQHLMSHCRLFINCNYWVFSLYLWKVSQKLSMMASLEEDFTAVSTPQMRETALKEFYKIKAIDSNYCFWNRNRLSRHTTYV